MENEKPYKWHYDSYTEMLEDKPETAEEWPEILKLVEWEKQRKEANQPSPERLAELDRMWEEQQKKNEWFAEMNRKRERELEEIYRTTGIRFEYEMPVIKPTPEAMKRQHPMDMEVRFNTYKSPEKFGGVYPTDRDGKYVIAYDLFMILHIYDRQRNNREVMHYTYHEFEDQFYMSIPLLITGRVDPEYPDGYAVTIDPKKLEKYYGDRYYAEAEFEKVRAVCVRPEYVDRFLADSSVCFETNATYYVDDTLENFRYEVMNNPERFNFREQRFDNCNRLYYTPEEREEIKAWHNS